MFAAALVGMVSLAILLLAMGLVLMDGERRELPARYQRLWVTITFVVTVTGFAIGWVSTSLDPTVVHAPLEREFAMLRIGALTGAIAVVSYFLASRTAVFNPAYGQETER